MLKKLNENFKNLAVKVWKDESAQGMTEYILLVVGLVVILGVFRNQFSGTIRSAIDNMTGKITDFIN